MRRRTIKSSARNRATGTQSTTIPVVTKFKRMFLAFIEVLHDTQYNRTTSRALFFGFWLLAMAISSLVVMKVKYTEIDWIAYMQEVEGFLNGSLDYSTLRGDTGPLVYPAGFVYVFSALYALTNRGQNIDQAQWIFAFFYGLVLASVFNIYRRCKVPAYFVLLVSATAYRMTSIFTLRMFNDCVAMMVYYGSINLMMSNHWNYAALLYSFAVSIKMNILLSAPGLFFYLLRFRGMRRTAVFISMCALLQLVLGAPFLIANPYAYVKGAFDFGRVFMYKWTVNWQFIPEPVFLSRRFHVSLIVGHLCILAMIAVTRWRKISRTVKTRDQKNDIMVRMMLESNFVGIVFARSLHYQFYVWYYHSIPLILRRVSRDNIKQLLGSVPVMLCIEGCWIMYPPHRIISAVLFSCHLWILFNIVFR